jgi:hypothetical protein
MRTISRKNRRYGFVSVLNILGYDLIFADKNETLMSIQAKDEPQLAFKTAGQSMSRNQIILKFSFVETVMTYKYYNFLDLIEALGGLSSAVGVVMTELTLLFIWLYIMDMIRVIYGRYKYDWIKTRNQMLKERIGTWKKVIEILIQKQKDDEATARTGLDNDLKMAPKEPALKSKKSIRLSVKNSSLVEDLKIINELEKQEWEIHDQDVMEQLE